MLPAKNRSCRRLPVPGAVFRIRGRFGSHKEDYRIAFERMPGAVFKVSGKPVARVTAGRETLGAVPGFLFCLQ